MAHMGTCCRKRDGSYHCHSLGNRPLWNDTAKAQISSERTLALDDVPSRWHDIPNISWVCTEERDSRNRIGQFTGQLGN